MNAGSNPAKQLVLILCHFANGGSAAGQTGSSYPRGNHGRGCSVMPWPAPPLACSIWQLLFKARTLMSTV